MRGWRASLVKDGPGVRKLLKSWQAWEKQYNCKRNFPDAKDDTKIRRISKMGEYNSNILDPQEAPDCSSCHFKAMTKVHIQKAIVRMLCNDLPGGQAS